MTGRLARVVAIGLCMLWAVSAQAGSDVKASVKLPASAHVTATADGCENNPGPYITLEGELKLGGLNGRLIFRNNEKGTHETTVDAVVDMVILDEGESYTFAKQPPRGGVGGNPWIYLQLLDGSGRAMSDKVLLGRCNQGLSDKDFNFGMLANAFAHVETGDCDNSGGPFISLNGELRLGGLSARLIFQNNEKGTHTHETPVTVDIVIIPAGESITFAKQPPQGGVGGNPRIYFQFTSPSGAPLSTEFYLGRCVQLGR